MTGHEIKSRGDLMNLAGQPGNDAIYMAFLTDAWQCGRWAALAGGEEELDYAKLLDIRVFDGEREFRAWRDNLDGRFRTRALDDGCGLPYYDETHILDSRAARPLSDGRTEFSTMAGGAYILPTGPDTDRVVVRTYFGVNQLNGIEYPVDWRVVRFIGASEA